MIAHLLAPFFLSSVGCNVRVAVRSILRSCSNSSFTFFPVFAEVSMYLQFHIPCRERESEQDQIELERSASCQWEKVKGDIVFLSMSERGCVGGDEAEEEGTGKGKGKDPDP